VPPRPAGAVPPRPPAVPRCRAGTGGRPGTAGVRPGARHRPPQARTLLAGRAQQPATGISAPARGQGPGPVIRLAQCRRIGEPPAAAQIAPRSRHPELIADDTVLGDSHRPGQRVTARPLAWHQVIRRPRRHTPAVRYPARPAPHGQRPGMPRHHRGAHPAHPLCPPQPAPPQGWSPGAGRPARDIPEPVPGPIQIAGPWCRTQDRRRALPAPASGPAGRVRAWYDMATCGGPIRPAGSGNATLVPPSRRLGTDAAAQRMCRRRPGASRICPACRFDPVAPGALVTHVEAGRRAREPEGGLIIGHQPPGIVETPAAHAVCRVTM
jgi:hypothetical protein